jgi:hypothetical protein
MRIAPLLTLACCCGLACTALAQQPAAPEAPPAPSPGWKSFRPAAAKPEAPPPAQPEAAPPAKVETEPPAPEGIKAPEEPAEPFEARVQRLIDDFNQRHDDRVLEMSSYGKAGDTDPSVKPFADPRKIEVELKDEQDREQTSRALAREYFVEARRVQGQEQALQAFIAKRQKTLDSLNKPESTANAHDMEIAAANLSRQPGNDAQVQALRRRLAEDELAAKDAATQQALAQQEAASAQEELKRLEALADSLTKEAKTYTADADSARQNQLHLADRLEYFAVSAQAEDVLDQGRKATAAVHHLAPSPEVQRTLQSLDPSPKANAKTETAKPCAETAADPNACPEPPAPEPKE